MANEDITISVEHAQAISGLLSALMVVMRHYQPSEELYDVLRGWFGEGGWGQLLQEGNPQGVWLLLEQATHLEGWLQAAWQRPLHGLPPLPAPPLAEVVSQSFARRREGKYYD